MKSKIITAATAVVMGMALVATPAQATPTTAVNIVALGDSVASGVGAGNYEPGTNVPGGCYRSYNSYSEQIVARLRAAGKQVNFTNVTCSGATTHTVRQTQLHAVATDTDVVYLTVGANDLDFAGFSRICIASDCNGAPSVARKPMIKAIAANLAKLLDEIKRQAPRAQVIMVGYGQPVTRNASTPSTADPICGSLSAAERNSPGSFYKVNDVNDVSTHLDLALLTTALTHGANYISPYLVPGFLWPNFAGHSLCDVKPQWYHGFDALAPGGDGEIAVFHPTDGWQAEMATMASLALAG